MSREPKNFDALLLEGYVYSLLGRFEEARDEFTRGATLTQNAREREFLLDRVRKAESKQL